MYLENNKLFLGVYSLARSRLSDITSAMFDSDKVVYSVWRLLFRESE